MTYKKKTFVTFGEIMLRLKPPKKERFFQSPLFEVCFGGSEANVAVGLAQFGEKVYFVSVVPDNPIGEGAISELRKFGVDTSFVIRRGNRLGIYYLEPGANQRPSRVIYDREHSAIYDLVPGSINWDEILSDKTWFHFSGITPAISPNLAEETLRAVKIAKLKGSVVSCDLNYRHKLWKYGKKADEVMPEIISNIDYLFANEEDIQLALGINVDGGIDVESEEIEKERYKRLTDKVLNTYPNIIKLAVTIRESYSADYSGWSSVLNNRKDFLTSKYYDIRDTVDRVGAGDSFAAALIYGYNHFADDLKALEFATAASCLKHSIPGDMPLLRVEEVLSLMKGHGRGRIER